MGMQPVVLLRHGGEPVPPAKQRLVQGIPAISREDEASPAELEICSLFMMQVQLTDGKLHQCLVPVATVMNHSAAAHIVRYGKVDAATGLLCFRAFRCAYACHGCEQSQYPYLRHIPQTCLTIFCVS